MADFMTLSTGGMHYPIRLSGNNTGPYFHSKDVCKVLGLKKPLDALNNYVESNHRFTLSKLVNLLTPEYISFGPTHFTQREGQDIFVSLEGLHALINSCSLPNTRKTQIKMRVAEWMETLPDSEW